MIKRIGLIFILQAGITLFAQEKKTPYQVGEYCSYTLSYGFINAAYAEYEIKEIVTLNNKKTYHIVAKGKTASFFDWFFKVRDRYETYINIETHEPVFFIRDVNEGGHIIKEEYIFNHQKGIVKSRDKSYSIPKKTQDMVSAFFFARALEKEKVLSDSVFFVTMFLDEGLYNLEVRYLYDEIVKTKWGDMNCMVFMPKMQKGRIFQHEEKMKIWITNDENHLLLKVEAEIWAGTIKAELNNFKGLKTPINKEKK